MEQRQKRSTIVLKYAKRRFDGGNEAELIRSIERQQEIEQFNRMYHSEQEAGAESSGMNYSAPLAVTPLSVSNMEATPVPPAPEVRFSRLGEIALRGPLQICIGLVGLLTTGLAIITFQRTQNHEMVAQSQAVFRDCSRTLRQGLWETLKMPTQLFQEALKRKACADTKS